MFCTLAFKAGIVDVSQEVCAVCWVVIADEHLPDDLRESASFHFIVNGILRLSTRPRPSSTVEGNLEREDDVEIEEDKKRK